MRTMKHIQICLDAEKSSYGEYGARLWFTRTGPATICVSAVGYRHQSLSDLESALLKAGCRYDFTEGKGVQKFDSQCGRTFTHFIEPLKDKRGLKS